MTKRKDNDSAYQMANRKAADDLTTLNEVVERNTMEQNIKTIVKNMGGNSDDVADWMDDWGCCKICQGEIPHGHQENCVIYANEKQVKELESALNSQITDCAILEVDKEIMQTEIDKLDAKVKELEKWNAEMVAIAAGGGTLDGYREMAERIVFLEGELSYWADEARGGFGYDEEEC